jgi:hypothetical protein
LGVINWSAYYGQCACRDSRKTRKKKERLISVAATGQYLFGSRSNQSEPDAALLISPDGVIVFRW